MVETKIWLFLGLMAVAAVAIPFGVRQMRRRGEEQMARALESLEQSGYVVDEGIGQNGRTFVRVWGTLDHPVALDLRIARKGRLLGRLGGGSSTATLDPGFEQSYRVVTSEPDRSRLILDLDIQQRLSRLPKLEFRLGSVETLLPPEYWRGGESQSERRLRRLWMIRIPGKSGRGDAKEELVELGRMLARSIAKNCLPPGTPDLSDFETGKAEAWL